MSPHVCTFIHGTQPLGSSWVLPIIQICFACGGEDYKAMEYCGAVVSKIQGQRTQPVLGCHNICEVPWTANPQHPHRPTLGQHKGYSFVWPVAEVKMSPPILLITLVAAPFWTRSPGPEGSSNRYSEQNGRCFLSRPGTACPAPIHGHLPKSLSYFRSSRACS